MVPGDTQHRERAGVDQPAHQPPAFVVSPVAGSDRRDRCDARLDRMPRRREAVHRRRIIEVVAEEDRHAQVSVPGEDGPIEIGIAGP